jgi:uncharacterized protein YecT (DUF1311 family)
MLIFCGRAHLPGPGARLMVAKRIALLSLIGLGAACFAQAAGTTPDCEKAETTAQMRACENARYEQANQELNALYTRLIKQLEPQRQEKLRIAQRAWIRFRDANADFLASSAEGGTLAPLLKVTALADMTEARVKELAKLPVH